MLQGELFVAKGSLGFALEFVFYHHEVLLLRLLFVSSAGRGVHALIANPELGATFSTRLKCNEKK